MDALPELHNSKLQLYTYAILKKVKNDTTLLQHTLNVFYRKWKSNDMEVVEEYCWALRQAVGKSCCCQSPSIVLDLGF